MEKESIPGVRAKRMGPDNRHDQKKTDLLAQSTLGDEVSWVVAQLSAEPLSAASGVATACSVFFLPFIRVNMAKAKSGTEQNRTAHVLIVANNFEFISPLVLYALHCCLPCRIDGCGCGSAIAIHFASF